jgi:hypothetical protein
MLKKLGCPFYTDMKWSLKNHTQKRGVFLTSCPKLLRLKWCIVFLLFLKHAFLIAPKKHQKTSKSSFLIDVLTGFPILAKKVSLF